MTVPCETIDCCPGSAFEYQTERPLVFGIIGDYGGDTAQQHDVVELMKSWHPEFILTCGDNQYIGSPSGSALYTDRIIGQYFRSFIHPYVGSYPLWLGESDAEENNFFPIYGNHDLDTLDGQPLRDYLALPGNERYYELVRGHAHFFMLNDGIISDHTTVVEPDGNTYDSVQGKWFQAAADASTAKWKFAFVHHPAYTSTGNYGPRTELQWPFESHGVHALFQGHNHHYERLQKDGLTAIVNGTGGQSLRPIVSVDPDSIIRYNSDYGAMRGEVTRQQANFKFYTRTGLLIDDFTLTQ